MVLVNTEMCGDRPALKIVCFRGHAIQVDLFLNNNWSSVFGRTAPREEVCTIMPICVKETVSHPQ